MQFLIHDSKAMEEVEIERKRVEEVVGAEFRKKTKVSRVTVYDVAQLLIL